MFSQRAEDDKEEEKHSACITVKRAHACFQLSTLMFLARAQQVKASTSSSPFLLFAYLYVRLPLARCAMSFASRYF